MFAPGWTHEAFDKAEAIEMQRKLWSQFESRLTPKRICALPLATSFSLGYGRRRMLQGRAMHTSAWANLSAQHLLPTFPPHCNSTPYFLQRGVAFLFPGLQLALESKCAFNGAQCLRISTRLALDDSSAAAPAPPIVPRAFFRLLAVHATLKGPCCISVVVGHRPSHSPRLEGTLLLVLNNEITGVRYIELPLGGARPPAEHVWHPLLQTPKLLNTMMEKYGMQPSLLLRSDGALDRYIGQEAPGPVSRARPGDAQAGAADGGDEAVDRTFFNFAAQEDDGAHVASDGVVWTRHWFVLAHNELRHRQIHEIRLMVAPPSTAESSSATPAGDATPQAELLLGEVALYHPSHVVNCPTRYDVCDSLLLLPGLSLLIPLFSLP